MANPVRPSFEDLKVENFIAQVGQDRYPPPDPASDEEESDDETTFRTPTAERLRSNLVAASQKFNLYFAAFQDEIHIYIPRGMANILSQPDAIIQPPVSAIAGPGFMNPQLPHAINHMMIAQLCNFEILLLACDDGDILAYYTHLLAQDTKKIEETTKPPYCSLKPFFHECVIQSAWGLAVHDKSRIIAVGSNARVVNLFSFPTSIPTTPLVIPAETLFNEYAPMDITPYLRSVLHMKEIVRFGTYGHNIPSLAFVDGPDDKASHVLAADINGNLWYCKLPGGGEKKRHTAPFPFSYRDIMGWGVLSLPLSYFKMKHPVPGTPQQSTNPKIKPESGSAILRTFRNDLQLIQPVSHDDKRDSLLINEVFKLPLGKYASLETFRRLNMIAVVPELNIVAIGTQSGKVKVYTMWRLPDEDGAPPARITITEAAVLPLKKHEMKRPVASLLGMTIAPVDRHKKDDQQWVLYAKRFRLFLHYTDHTILSYELWRPEDDELVGF